MCDRDVQTCLMFTTVYIFGLKQFCELNHLKAVIRLAFYIDMCVIEIKKNVIMQLK